ncbi:tetratricopeptide repeat protein [Silvanigrella aquatica]|uniref:Ancillary SecYEG translocon subunit/Cell division coordinator CpoB TPR domain-containing protein n=1 Tax=Silvanigrella aquatica TaxID=1915309 RepID=A0A1L4CXS7_9BACT|nr:tetratricopeptide repeat protein [Silvanigrella aquatica]APJ02748.1 hypothetical protein AXG55_01935 [Silvanigrella aquatica]
MIRLLRNSSLDQDASKSTLINPKRSSENTLFEETSYRAIRTAQRRKWTLISLIASVILFGIGILIYNQFVTSKNQRLAKEYSAIEEIYNQENLEFQKKYTEAKGNLPANVKADNAKSMEQFAQFAKTYASEPMGWLAGIRAGNYYITHDLNLKAKEILEPIVQTASNQPLIQVRVRTALAGIYAAEKDDQKALLELKIVEEIPQNPFPDQARFLRAQILYYSGNKAEALKILNQIISNPDSSNSANPLNQNAGSQIKQQAKIWLNYLES